MMQLLPGAIFPEASKHSLLSEHRQPLLASYGAVCRAETTCEASFFLISPHVSSFFHHFHHFSCSFHRFGGLPGALARLLPGRGAPDARRQRLVLEVPGEREGHGGALDPQVGLSEPFGCLSEPFGRRFWCRLQSVQGLLKVWQPHDKDGEIQVRLILEHNV